MYLEIVGDRRSIDIDASMATHRPGKRYHPGYQYGVDMSTSKSDFSRGNLFAGVGKEGEDLGKLRKENSRNAPDNF